MPYRKIKLPSGKYKVMGPGGVHAKGTTEEKADKQMTVLRAIEHGWKPTKKK